VLSLGAVVSTDAPRAAAMPELQRCDAAAELVPGSYGADVFCLQFALLISGIRVSYNGVYDQPTQDGVRWFQATHPPLRADGLAGEQTLAALGILAVGRVAPVPIPLPAGRLPGGVPGTSLSCLADATIEPGERGESVSCLQRELGKLGFYRGAPSGQHDAASQEAVRAFQRQRPPLDVDGYAGPRTLAALGIWSGITIARGATSVPRTPPGDVPRDGAAPPGPFPAPVQPEPLWGLTPAGIPVYGSRTPCTRAQADVIAAEFARDGADAATQQWAVYVASREGGCRYDAVNINPATRDDSHCTFQLNVLSGMFEPRGELGRRGWTPELVRSSLGACADAASDLWVFCGRGPWTPPYSCRPPWEGASLPGPPLLPTTTTTPATPAGADAPPQPTVPADAGIPAAPADTGATTTSPASPPPDA